MRWKFAPEILSLDLKWFLQEQVRQAEYFYQKVRGGSPNYPYYYYSYFFPMLLDTVSTIRSTLDYKHRAFGCHIMYLYNKHHLNSQHWNVKWEQNASECTYDVYVCISQKLYVMLCLLKMGIHTVKALYSEKHRHTDTLCENILHCCAYTSELSSFRLRTYTTGNTIHDIFYNTAIKIFEHRFLMLCQLVFVMPLLVPPVSSKYFSF